MTNRSNQVRDAQAADDETQKISRALVANLKLRKPEFKTKEIRADLINYGLAKLGNISKNNTSSV